MPLALDFTPRLLLLGGSLSLGLLLLASSLPWARPRRRLAAWFAAQDAQIRLRAQLARPARPTLSALPGLNAALLAGLDPLVGRSQRLTDLLGGGQTAQLQRMLRVCFPGCTPRDWQVRRLLVGAFALALVVTLSLCSLLWFGQALPPLFGLLVVALAGSWPDLALRQRYRTRQTRLLLEADAMLEYLALGVSAGLGVEQAMQDAADLAQGELAASWRRVLASVALGERSFQRAVEALAEATDLPELWNVSAALAAADRQGIAPSAALLVQADALRESKRTRLIAGGARATRLMLLPMALGAFPVFLLVLLAPALSIVLSLGR